MRPEIRILWSDSGAGTAVGITTLALYSWLATFYRLPREVVRWIGFANIVYGAFAALVALTVVGALRAGTPRRARFNSGRRLVWVLLVANAAWACVCLGLLVKYGAEASLFGCAHLVLEGLFVLGLAVVEYRRVLPVLTLR